MKVTYYDRLKNFATQTSPWILLTLAVYLVGFLYLFIENFIFSASLDLLHFRGIDDQVFQAYLRGFHLDSKVFNVSHGFSYGWVYWLPLIILTYPFYFLSVNFGIDLPLATLPRQISLLWMMGTAYLLFKISGIYTKDTFLKSLVLLLFLCFHTTGYFSLRFGTIPQIMFFSALTFWLAARKETLAPKDCYWIAVSMAAAIATKLSALLIAPILLLIVADRFSWRLNQKNLGIAVRSFLIAAVSYLALAQPDIEYTRWFMNNTKVDFKALVDKYGGFLDGIVQPTLPWFVFWFVLFGILTTGVLSWKKGSAFFRKDYLYIFWGLVLVIGYLVLITSEIERFFTGVSFLLPLGVLVLAHFNKRLKYLFGMCIVLISYVFNGYAMSSRENTWNTFYVKK